MRFLRFNFNITLLLQILHKYVEKVWITDDNSPQITVLKAFFGVYNL